MDDRTRSAGGRIAFDIDDVIRAEVLRLQPLQRVAPLRHEGVRADHRWRLPPKVRVVGLNLIREAGAKERPVLQVEGCGEAGHYLADLGTV